LEFLVEVVRVPLVRKGASKTETLRVEQRPLVRGGGTLQESAFPRVAADAFSMGRDSRIPVVKEEMACVQTLCVDVRGTEEEHYFWGRSALYSATPRDEVVVERFAWS
jgi:hypothetical protein